ncbi:hypothetical protein Ddye_017104 [Dipteronia dyeriana]|uniref:Uncharacterized protein n=1 Tax=Dipteronia dyeriana TaxID=168575 RepID=A0AAD9U924_9ROSI|nr:hypothetical protein Ddye_017104 [Dipteronia dyeriana]
MIRLWNTAPQTAVCACCLRRGTHNMSRLDFSAVCAAVRDLASTAVAVAPPARTHFLRLFLASHISTKMPTNGRGTPYVEAIILDGDRHREKITHLKLNGKSFSGMSNLRLLTINDVDVHLSEDLEYLSNELRFYFHLQPSMKYLKTINLDFSLNLIKTQDFEMIPNLERRDIQCCTKLHEVHKSVGSFGKLVVLNLNKCENLVIFPSDVYGLKSLKILNLNGCSTLDKLPLNLREVEHVKELDVSGTAIGQVPLSIVQLKYLKTLSLCGCKVEPSKTWSFSLIRSWLMLPTRKSGCMGLMLPSLVGLSFLRELNV